MLHPGLKLHFFLFRCRVKIDIHFSLIAAAVTYIMWRSVGQDKISKAGGDQSLKKVIAGDQFLSKVKAGDHSLSKVRVRNQSLSKVIAGDQSLSKVRVRDQSL